MHVNTVTVCVPQRCVTVFYPNPGLDLEPDSDNVQAAAGHGHLGLARGRYSLESGVLGLLLGGGGGGEEDRGYRTGLRGLCVCVCVCVC